MSKEVSAAIGTQRQFAKQPEALYQLRLESPNFSAGLDPRMHVDYDAQLLARSLGVIPKAIMAEMQAQEQREKDQATLVNADKLLAGKSKEDLQKFDRMVALQNSSDQFDLTDNKYAMAVLDKGIGKMASTFAKQQWADDPAAQKPESVEDAVRLYGQYLDKNRKDFGDNIQNSAAFEQGYYEGAAADTMKVANEAHTRINDDKRQKMAMLSSSELQDLIYSGATGEAFSNGVSVSLKKMQMATRDRKGFMQAISPLMQMITENDFTTERLNAFCDYMYDQDTKIGDMINTYPMYKKIAQNFDVRVADDIYSKAMRSDGTLDMAYANKLLSQLPFQFSKGDGVPSHMLPVVGGETLVAPESFKGSLPLVGGAVLSLGYNNAQFTNSNNPNMVAIDLGADNVSEDKREALKSYFQQYFSDVSFTSNGDSVTMELGGYNGKMKGANPREESAAAYSPERISNIERRFRAKSNDNKRRARQRQITASEDTSIAALTAINQIEAVDAIANADIPDELKDKMQDALERKSKKEIAQFLNGTMSARQMAWYNYEKGIGTGVSLAKDWATKRKYEAACQDPNYPKKDFDALQEEADAAYDRINLYWEQSTGGAYNYSNNDDETTTTEEPAPAKVSDEVKQKAINDTKEWVKANPKNFSHEEILARITRAAPTYGLTSGELIDAVFDEK